MKKQESPAFRRGEEVNRLRSFRCPDGLWAAVKAKAAREGETVTAVILRALNRYIA